MYCILITGIPAAGKSTMAALLAEQLMKSNRPFILENNFEKISKEPLEKILEKYSYTAITVTLTGNYPEIYRRFVERNNSPDRHRGHVVNDGYPEKNPGGPVCPVPYEDFEKVRIERVIRLKNVPDGPFFNRQFCVGAGRRKTVMIAAEKSHTRFFGAVGAKSAPTWREK